MNKSEKKVSKHTEKSPALSSLIQLKLIESSHNSSNKFKLDEHYLKAMGSNINTPSTIADFKKFHSCELGAHKKESVDQHQQYLKSQVRHRRCESATKILTLRQIKLEEDKSKQKEKQQPVELMGKSSSRKLFVSIAKRNDQSKEKKQIKAEINHIDCNLVAEEKHKKQKIKLNVYKEIARKNMHNLK